MTPRIDIPMVFLILSWDITYNRRSSYSENRGLFFILHLLGLRGKKDIKYLVPQLDDRTEGKHSLSKAGILFSEDIRFKMTGQVFLKRPEVFRMFCKICRNNLCPDFL